MLILSRKTKQTIVIGNAVVEVVQVQGKRVVLGIKAPNSTNIRRGELPERKAA